jgi:hypothetical protein
VSNPSLALLLHWNVNTVFLIGGVALIDLRRALPDALSLLSYVPKDALVCVDSRGIVLAI